MSRSDPLLPLAQTHEAFTCLSPTNDAWLSCPAEQRPEFRAHMLDLHDQMGAEKLLDSYRRWLQAGNRRKHIWGYIQMQNKLLLAEQKLEVPACMDPTFSPAFGGVSDCCGKRPATYDQDQRKFVCVGGCTT